MTSQGAMSLTLPHNKEQKVIEILRDIARPKKQIDKSTRVYEDLLISGDDAAELIDSIHREFGTSFNGFRFGDYFPDETESLFYRLFLLFARSRKKPLSVGHLFDVVDRGEWFE